MLVKAPPRRSGAFGLAVGVILIVFVVLGLAGLPDSHTNPSRTKEPATASSGPREVRFAVQRSDWNQPAGLDIVYYPGGNSPTIHVVLALKPDNKRVVHGNKGYDWESNPLPYQGGQVWIDATATSKANGVTVAILVPGEEPRTSTGVREANAPTAKVSYPIANNYPTGT